MHTTFLKFPDQATCLSTFAEAGMVVIDPETEKVSIIQSTHEYAIDEIGIIYLPGQYTTDPDTGELIESSPPTPIDGWHVNVIFLAPKTSVQVIDRLLDREEQEVIEVDPVPEPLRQYIVNPTPSTPYRLFAGVEA